MNSNPTKQNPNTNQQSPLPLTPIQHGHHHRYQKASRPDAQSPSLHVQDNHSKSPTIPIPRRDTQTRVRSPRDRPDLGGVKQGEGSSAVKAGPSRNANHLLNFQYRTTPRADGRRKGGWGHHSGRHGGYHPPAAPFNKELFLQANFRFLVSDTGDYSTHLLDSDKALSWRHVAAVELESTVIPQCPICLDSPPLCPQITYCGHMFCFPCILQYLMVDGEEQRKEHWRKCPLCFVSVGTADLRSVTVHVADAPKVNDSIKFSLIARSKMGSVPVECSSLSHPTEGMGSLPCSDNGRCHRFSKFTLTASDGAQESMAATREALLGWMNDPQRDEEDGDKVLFASTALECLGERFKAWEEQRVQEFLSCSPSTQKLIISQQKVNVSPKPWLPPNREPAAASSSPSPSPSLDVVLQTEAAMTDLKSKQAWTFEKPFSDDEEEKGGDSPPTVESMAAAVGEAGAGGSESDGGLAAMAAAREDRNEYLYFQSSDGRPYFLHPLNMRCLLHHYGHYGNLPHSVEGRIVEIEEQSQTEVTRKRHKFLSHIPLTSTLHFVEIDLRKSLPPSAMAPFLAEIEKRKLQRRKAAQQNRKEKAMAEKAESALQPAPPTAEDFAAILSAMDLDCSPPWEAPEASGSSSSEPVAMAAAGSSQPVSFSQVARLGYASGVNAPGLSVSPAMAAAPGPELKGAWAGKSPVAPSPIQAMAAAAEGEREGRSMSLGRKKKGKKGVTVLMETGVRRG